MPLTIIAFVAGVLVLQQQARLIDWEWSLFYFALICCLGWTVFFFRHQCKPIFLRQLCVLALAGWLGFLWANWCAVLSQHESLPVTWEKRDLQLTGVIENLPSYSEQGIRFNFKVEMVSNLVRPDWFPEHIVLFWKIQTDGSLSESLKREDYPIKPGQRWQLATRLQRPHGNANPLGFDYEVWLLEQGIRATGAVRQHGAIKNACLDEFVWSANQMVNRWRDSLRQRIHRTLPNAEYVGVITALVMGDQREIAQSDWKIFNRTGVAHLISISGLHITMLSGLVAWIVAFFWRRSFFTSAQLPLRLPTQKIAVLAASVVAFLYVALSGFGVPALRTLTMIIVVALAVWSGRMLSLSVVLSAALGVVVVLDPWAVLWPGFWLSFAAVAVIAYVTLGRSTQIETAPFFRQQWLRLKSATRMQIAITIGLLPLCALLFSQISLVSPIANAIAIPIFSFVVTPTALISALLPSPVAGWGWQFANWVIRQLNDLLVYLGDSAIAIWRLPNPSPFAFFLAVIGTLWLLAPRGWPWRFLGFLCWLPLLFASSAVPQVGNFTITAFDVGQGMSVLVETTGHRLLYDAGPGYSATSDAGSRTILPYLYSQGISKLDTLVVSHQDNDHSGGAISVQKGVQVNQLLSSLSDENNIVALASSHQTCQKGQQWQWDEIRFEILHPANDSDSLITERPNARSCVLKISSNKFSILLPGDIEAKQEIDLLKNEYEQLSSTVLLAPHHGSGTSSTAAFLQAVKPQYAIFQVGYLNRYHHPKSEVFKRYGELGIRRLRTDQSGAIRIEFGNSIDISEYRKVHARYWYAQP